VAIGGVNSRRGFTDAQTKLPDPFTIDVRASPRRLTGHAPKLVFRASRKLMASARDESTRSIALATVT